MGRGGEGGGGGVVRVGRVWEGGRGWGGCESGESVGGGGRGRGRERCVSVGCGSGESVRGREKRCERVGVVWVGECRREGRRVQEGRETRCVREEVVGVGSAGGEGDEVCEGGGCGSGECGRYLKVTIFSGSLHVI